jgi:7,8-dihydropterin-6-yl-methyl-4-(beta-D-ribofuranosyl)aminobenzene 5'-phosphate synthase
VSGSLEQARLATVDVVDVTVLVDNVIDINLPSTDVARRALRPYDWSERQQLRAEHGYALLVTVAHGQQRQSLL